MPRTLLLEKNLVTDCQEDLKSPSIAEKCRGNNPKFMMISMTPSSKYTRQHSEKGFSEVTDTTDVFHSFFLRISVKADK